MSTRAKHSEHLMWSIYMGVKDEVVMVETVRLLIIPPESQYRCSGFPRKSG